MSNVIFSPHLYNLAQDIADSCMGDAVPSCQAECPMHTDVKQYLKLAHLGDYASAVNVIRKQLFLPQVLGRICAHPCETACRRNQEFSQPLSIAAIKRFVAEQADDPLLWDTDIAPETGKHVAIVGAGPAGAQVAIDLRRQGHRVSLYEKLNAAGGMLRVGIPAFRLPNDVIDAEYRYLDRLGIEMHFNYEVGKDTSFDMLRQNHDALVLAHGAHIGKLLAIPGHQAYGVFSAAEFLKEISESHTFDRAGKRIMVVGGGDVAIDCARSALRLGASAVYQCSRKPMALLNVSQHEIKQAVDEGIIFNTGWKPEQINTTHGNVSSITLRQLTDESGTTSPSLSENVRSLEVDTIIFAVGQQVADISAGALEQTSGGRYVVDKDTLATAIDGVFVAGDAGGSSIAVEAMALGKKAAISVHRYLSGSRLAEGRDFVLESSYTSPLCVPLPKGTNDEPRLESALREVKQRINDFSECDSGLTEEQVKQESARCLQCECKLCMNECIMLNDFTDSPKTICKGFIDTNVLDPQLAYSCNACQQCSIVCPKGLPLKDVLIGARQDMVLANGGQSPMKGHAAVNLHQKLSFLSFFTMAKKGTRKS